MQREKGRTDKLPRRVFDHERTYNAALIDTPSRPDSHQQKPGDSLSDIGEGIPYPHPLPARAKHRYRPWSVRPDYLISGWTYQMSHEG
jgi:hypothetical protein